MMKKIEYKIVLIKCIPIACDVGVNRINSACMDAGSHGWELVSCEIVENENAVLVFKREVN